MATIGTISCLLADANTGVGSCNFEPALMVLPIAIPKNDYFEDADIVDIADFLNDKFYNADPTQRWYPLPILVGIDDATTQAGVETYAFGSSEDAGVDYPAWTGKFRKGQFCGFKNAYKFNGRAAQYDWIWMDRKGRLIGRQDASTGVMRVYGWDVDSVKSNMWIPGNQSANNDYKITWRFSDIEQLTSQLIAVETGLSPYNFSGIETVNILQVGVTGANGVFPLSLKTACSATNIGIQYNDQLDVTGAWDVVRESTGNLITFAVSYNTTTGLFTIDLDQTDPDYLAGAYALIKLKNPQALSALGVEWYESTTYRALMN